jgi:dTDP-glucose pyrophosphorylase/predicted transcriptional regulator
MACEKAKMTSIEDIFCAPDTSILEVMRCLNQTSTQIVLIVDTSRRLVGSVTDGDVRRAILAGVDVQRPVVRIMNSAPITAKLSSSELDLLRIMRQHGVGQVPLVNSAGQVVALRTYHQHGIGDQQAHWVVLMAGGLGTRLRPITETIPKPMISVAGKPLLETILNSFLRHGFSRFYFSVNYRADIIKNHFQNGQAFGADIGYLNEDHRLGTAGALGLLPARPERSFVVMNGDVLTNLSYPDMIDFHLRTGAVATMAVFEYKIQVPYGVINVVNEAILSIREKPMHSWFINAGIYALRPSVLDHCDGKTFLDMPTLLQRLMDQGEMVNVFQIPEYWRDVGRPDDLSLAEEEYETVFGDDGAV